MTRSVEKVLMKGNEAVVEAAIDAGCRFYAGYPITPQNEIPEIMSYRMKEAGGTFIQGESELISINMVFGAAAAGARAMTTSSSPGISLMQEGISYMAGCELPAVIVNVMRGGPGLGNIAPSQSDYFQSVKPGHGDYRLITLAPSNLQEMYDFTFEAFDYADKYRNPVMVLADGLLGQLMESAEIKRERKPLYLGAEKDWALTGAKGRHGRRIVSLLMKPGMLEKHNMHLKEKYDAITAAEKRWETVNCDTADYLIAAFGTVARIARGTMEMAKELKLGLFRPVTLWPYPYEALKKAAERVKKVFVFEMNLGQMVEDVKLGLVGAAGDAEVVEPHPE
ncbi:MAG TPA: 3-methyl-2-oxobutanoate dehydrogenase subunit VorB, partial [Candidatus Goldiibacteriota bacterium]|nr:3-methyl-2-oxobutanoate dehydrogenase subunit VorB [Candidatus Goldiibacteriota bacterium]